MKKVIIMSWGVVCLIVAIVATSPATVTYDLLQWFRNPNWQTSHLEGTAQDGSVVKQYVYDTGHNLIYTKSQVGYPWDIKSYDNGCTVNSTTCGFWDWVTEKDWTSPNDYKANSPKMFMVPRYWNGDNNWVHGDGSIPVGFFVGCKKVSSGANSPTFTLTGPVSHNFGGNIGTLSTIIVNYQWSPKDVEHLYLTTQHGWVLWTYYHNGTMTQFSLHNHVVTGTVKPIVGCLNVP